MAALGGSIALSLGAASWGDADAVVAGAREACIVSETQGLVRSVDFNLGDALREGQELLRVDERIAALNMSRAKEQYEAAPRA